MPLLSQLQKMLYNPNKYFLGEFTTDQKLMEIFR